MSTAAQLFSIGAPMTSPLCTSKNQQHKIAITGPTPYYEQVNSSGSAEPLKVLSRSSFDDTFRGLSTRGREFTISKQFDETGKPTGNWVIDMRWKDPDPNSLLSLEDLPNQEPIASCYSSSGVAGESDTPDLTTAPTPTTISAQLSEEDYKDYLGFTDDGPIEFNADPRTRSVMNVNSPHF
ncbi:uncharacterized protein IL334_004041 [Kwoniella shivajii]|uniref:AGC-kinase C-terminal domain-containing protein n=1 Tax=Kwoniella shivajii TaxID=564305 RepID=A0ABZ1CZ81_9TREE|nr:hypothetical protein IL334_004041 [Kwoniella shivajii]